MKHRLTSFLIVAALAVSGSAVARDYSFEAAIMYGAGDSGGASDKTLGVRKARKLTNWVSATGTDPNTLPDDLRDQHEAALQLVARRFADLGVSPTQSNVETALRSLELSSPKAVVWTDDIAGASFCASRTRCRNLAVSWANAIGGSGDALIGYSCPAQGANSRCNFAIEITGTNPGAEPPAIPQPTGTDDPDPPVQPPPPLVDEYGSKVRFSVRCP